MRIRSVLAVGAALALLLSGCSRGQEANDTLPTASSSASAEATLEPLGPPDLPMPAEARERTEGGALTSASYFLELTAFAIQQMDGDVLVDLSTACEYCANLSAAITADAAAGLTYLGGEVELTDEGQVVLEGDTAEVAFSLTQSPLEVVDANGAIIPERSQPEFTVFSSVSLRWSNSQTAWLVSQVTNT